MMLDIIVIIIVIIGLSVPLYVSIQWAGLHAPYCAADHSLMQYLGIAAGAVVLFMGIVRGMDWLFVRRLERTLWFNIRLALYIAITAGGGYVTHVLYSNVEPTNVCETTAIFTGLTLWLPAVALMVLTAGPRASNAIMRQTGLASGPAVPRDFVTFVAPGLSLGSGADQAGWFSHGNQVRVVRSTRTSCSHWDTCAHCDIVSFTDMALPLAKWPVGVCSAGWPQWNIGEEADARLFADAVKHYLTVVEPRKRCVWIGNSRGCSTVLGALNILASDPLWETVWKQRIACVFCFGAFASVDDVMRFRHGNTLGPILRWFATLRIFGFCHDWSEKWAPIALAPNTPAGVPVSIIVGKRDTTVPAASGARLVAAMRAADSKPVVELLELDTDAHHFMVANHEARVQLMEHVKAVCKKAGPTNGNAS
jgi:hypothetical protein